MFREQDDLSFLLPRPDLSCRSIVWPRTSKADLSKFCVDGIPGRRTGEHGPGVHEHLHAPRHDLRPIGLPPGICEVGESGGSEGRVPLGCGHFYRECFHTSLATAFWANAQ